MKGVSLYPEQLSALSRMRNGCILCGGTGSGKSRTSLAYFYTLFGGKVNTDEYILMDKELPDLYIITTAKKRNDGEWEDELIPFSLTTNYRGVYSHKVIIDSWQMIKKYKDVTGAFFIFDEQHTCGTGAWSKSFIRIARQNKWILLSATPGDKWEDYAAVFIANGYYRNFTDFRKKHMVISLIGNRPKVEAYLNEGRLLKLRKMLVVNMDRKIKTTSHNSDIYCEYDHDLMRHIMRKRWDVWKDKPIKNASGLCYAMRRVANMNEMRSVKLLEIFEKHSKLIVFYNFDYELDILLNLHYGENVAVAQCNGHKHDSIPKSKRWIYLVQYNSGSEGWNCIETDTIVFYSQTYSYKTLIQAKGRIDRLNTPFAELYYYHLKSKSKIDLAIEKALRNKKKFNELDFYKVYTKETK